LTEGIEVKASPEKENAAQILIAGEVIAHALAYNFYPKVQDETLILQDSHSAGLSYTVRLIPTAHKGLVPILITPLHAEGRNIHLTFRGTKLDNSLKRGLDPSGTGSTDFAEESDKIITALLDAVAEQYAHSQQKITLTLSGHGLGGADAQRSMAGLLHAINEGFLHSEKIGCIQLLGYQSAGIDARTDAIASFCVDQLLFSNKLPRLKCFWYHFADDMIQQSGDTNIFAAREDTVETHLIKVFAHTENEQPLVEFKYRSLKEIVNPLNIRSHFDLMVRAHRDKTFINDPERIEYYTNLDGQGSIIRGKLQKKSRTLQVLQRTSHFFSWFLKLRLTDPAPRLPSDTLAEQAGTALRTLDALSYSVTVPEAPANPLLQHPCLYNPADPCFDRIVKKARERLRPGPDGKIPPDQLTRFLDGDTAHLPDHLNEEIQQIFANLPVRHIFTDIDDITQSDNNIHKFIYEQGKQFQPLTVLFDSHRNLRLILHPSVRDFMQQCNIDSITADAIVSMLEILTKTALELICRPDNFLQDWLCDPDTFDLARIYPTQKQQTEAMPDILKAILSILTPTIHGLHKDFFDNLMRLMMAFTETGIGPIREAIVSGYIAFHYPEENEEKEEKEYITGKTVSHFSFFQEKKQSDTHNLSPSPGVLFTLGEGRRSEVNDKPPHSTSSKRGDCLPPQVAPCLR